MRLRGHSNKYELPHGANMRDLGGWPCASGQTARFRYVRSGLLNGLNRSELRQVMRYGNGISHVLDLRSALEAYADHDVLASKRTIDYYAVSLYNPDLAKGTSFGDQLSGGYRQMIDNKQAMRRIFALFATWASDSSDGVILYHCAGGVDRTGIITMILLGLAGVHRQDICREYLLSFASYSEIDKALRSPGEGGSYATLNERRETFLDAYDALVGDYGGFAGYLKACGLSNAQIEAAGGYLLA